jgi:heme-degrading monooxygenase HmoA
MYVRIYWGKIYPGAWEAIEERYRALMAIDAPGLLGRLVTRDVNDPESMFTITLWRDLESVRAWEDSPAYADIFAAALSPFIVGAQSVSLCEVRAADMQNLADLVRLRPPPTAAR